MALPPRVWAGIVVLFCALAFKPGASGSARVAYAISNQGTKTLFTEDRATAVQPVTIRPV
jgi:hypothetical protein